MQFVTFFACSAIAVCLVYFAAVLNLIDAPIRAEYWVGEMIVIKKDLAKRYSGNRKIVVAGGSSTLFGIDAEYASTQLDVPVVNFGLHKQLRLGKILQVVTTVVERGDLLVLSLEPPYFDCHEKQNEWQVKNVIAWDHTSWMEMDFWEKAEFITLVSPTTFGEMIVADMQRRFFPEKTSDRLNTLDELQVLSKFRSRTIPLVFAYSAYHLNDFGDMLRTDGAKFKGAARDVRTPKHVCSETKNQLIGFVRAMEGKGVQVHFANTPYIDSGVGSEEIRKSDSGFQKDFASVGCFIDKREELVFDNKYFFNSDLHLNNEGRRLRTDLFIAAIRKKAISGSCTFKPSA